MEDLSTAIGVISVLLEVLRQSGEISGESAPVTVEIVQMQSIRSSTREQRIPAGCTQGLLAVNSCKDVTSSSKVIQIRRAGQRIAISSNNWTQIIKDHHHHIRPSWRSSCVQQHWHHQREQETSSDHVYGEGSSQLLTRRCRHGGCGCRRICCATLCP